LAKLDFKNEENLVKFTLEKKIIPKNFRKSSKISPELKTLNWTNEAYFCPKGLLVPFTLAK
jgi:hypothetical protein